MIYRIEALGTASDIPVRWIYYLLSDTAGHRVAIVFTMEQDQENEFNDADLDWIRSLEFLSTGEPQDTKSREDVKEIDTHAPVS